MRPSPTTPPTAGSPLRRLIVGLVLGMVGLLIGMLGTNVAAFRAGVLPTATITRSGTAMITSCSLTWTTMYECRSTVTWSGTPSAGLTVDLPPGPERTVLSTTDRTGTVVVTGRVYRPLGQGAAGELVLPSDQTAGRSAAWLLLGIAASIVLCVAGFRLGARLTRPKAA